MAFESKHFDLEQALLEVKQPDLGGKSSGCWFERPLLDLESADSVLDRGRFELNQGLTEVRLRRFSRKISLLCIDQPSLDGKLRRLEVEQPPLAMKIWPLDVDRRLIAVHCQALAERAKAF